MAWRVLVVDDETEMVNMIRERLTMAGYEIMTATSGAEALVLAHRNKPDLILMDVSMPDFTGVNVLQQVRAKDHTKKIPIIFMSGLIVEEIEDRCHDAGIMDFQMVTKPINFEELLRMMKSALS
jgi:DNA-binding response OmpR family regulator